MVKRKYNKLIMIKKEIKSPFANVRNKPNFNSVLETQLIHGEKVLILSNQNDWSYICSEEDNYKGWIKTNEIGDITNKTHKIKNLSTYVFKEPNHKSKVICKLFLNSKIRVESFEGSWIKLTIKDKVGFLHKNSIVDLNKNDKDWINICLKFQNAPYLWGGKTFEGIDCSGLIQLSLQYCGIKFPRNTSEQIEFTSNFENTTKNASKGTLIFWDEHVGVMINDTELIHSNMYHLKVHVEKISIAVERIGKIKQLKKIKI